MDHTIQYVICMHTINTNIELPENIKECMQLQMYRTNDIGFKSKITAKIAKIFECESPGKINNTFNIKFFKKSINNQCKYYCIKKKKVSRVFHGVMMQTNYQAIGRRDASQ